MGSEEKKRLIVLKASAGSGKTYRLSQRYINLLKDYVKWRRERKGRERKLCALENPEKLNSLDSIVAITFTNKAAAEMKARVLLFLKEIACGKKGEKDGFYLSEEEALEVLVDIIEDFSDLRITTIDSFMNRIFKAFAFEFNIYPDYEITFKKDEIFDIALNEFFSKENEKAILDFVSVLLEVEKSGFDGERMIRKALIDYKKSSLEVCSEKKLFKDEGQTLDFLKTFLLENLKGRDSFPEEDIEEFEKASSFNQAIKSINLLLEHAFKRLQGIYEKNSSLFNGHKVRWLKKESAQEVFSSGTFTKSSWWSAESVEAFLKNGKKLSFEDERDFDTFLSDFVFLKKCEIIFKGAYEGLSSISVYCSVSERENSVKKALNIVEGKNIAESLKGFLKEEILSYAFCKMGERIKHYLIDEFQDTSEIQFDAMFPLIGNALSEGGTLFVVGDKKQAIYGWRGGDYRVFDRVEKGEDQFDNSLLLTVEEGEYLNETVKHNYRSAKEIVDFNNSLFEKIGKKGDGKGENLSEEVNEKVLELALLKFGEKEKDKALKVAEEIERVFANCSQLPVKDEKGYVSVKLCAKEKNLKKEVEEFLKNEFFDILGNTIERYPLRDIMILGRSKSDIALVIDYIFEFSRERGIDIPFITEDSLKLILNPEIKKVLTLALFCINPYDVEIFKSLGENGFFPLSDRKGFFSALKKVSTNFALSVLKGIVSSYVDSKIWDDSKTEKLFESVFFAENLSPYEFFMKLLSDFNNIDVDNNVAYFDRFLEIVLNLSEKQYSLSEIVDYFYLNEDITVSMPENVDALKLMTIHKAKGLEAEVVIIPFYQWDMARGESGEIISLEIEEGKSLAVRLNSDLRAANEYASKLYFEKEKRKFIESLNLMYVANTRPKKELYIRGAFPISKSKKSGEINPSGNLNAASVLYFLADGLRDKGDEQNKIKQPENGLKVFECFYGNAKKGEKERAKEKKEKDEKVLRFAESIRENLTVVDEGDFDIESKARQAGNLFHLAMSFVGKVENVRDIEQIASKCFKKSLNLSGLKREDYGYVLELVEKAIKNLFNYFNDIEDYWNEKEIVGKNGAIFRVDRLVKKNGKYFLIDYKTGERDKDKHKIQVANYLRALKRGGIEAKGLIYYAESGEVVNVRI